MKDKGILFRRILYGLCLILSLVFITYKGGNLPYMLFGLVVFNTIIAIVYILYVFATVRIYQGVTDRRVTKMEFAPYTLKVCNESFFAYRDVQITFFSHLSEIRGVDKKIRIQLDPGQSFVVSGELFCKYSGTYYAGVDSIEVMDYFKIFRIRFPMPEKLKVMVNPRILEGQEISRMLEEESHNSSWKGSIGYLLDSEVRKFQPSDNKKRIHWRNSAKKQELMVRNLAEEELSEYVVIMDGTLQKTDFDTHIERCDKLREQVIALVNAIYSSGYYVRVVLGESFDREIFLQRDFNAMFQRLVDYSFGPEEHLEKIIRNLNQYYKESVPFILVTTKDTELANGFLEQLKWERKIWWVNIDSLTVQ